MARTFLLILCVLEVLTGCVTPDQYTAHLRQQFVGKSLDTAIAEYGPPTLSAKFQDGKIHEWTRYMGQRGLSSADNAAPAPARICTWRVVTDKKGIITHAGWQGDACYNQLQPLSR